MSFHDVRMNVLVSWGAVGGPSFDTSIVKFRNGREVRLQHLENALGEWDVAHGVRTKEEMAELVAFFRERRGRAYGFRFRDWTDYTLIGEPMSPVGDGVTTLFSAYKIYGTGLNNELRRIHKLDSSPQDVATAFYLDGVPDPIGNWSIDYNNGQATRTAGAPGAAVIVTMDGEFDVPSRFDMDQMKVNLVDYNAQTWGQISIQQITPPPA